MLSTTIIRNRSFLRWPLLFLRGGGPKSKGVKEMVESVMGRIKEIRQPLIGKVIKISLSLVAKMVLYYSKDDNFC